MCLSFSWLVTYVPYYSNREKTTMYFKINMNSAVYMVFCALSFLAQCQASLLSYPRKPILNYLVRYKLGHVKAKLHGDYYGGYGYPHPPPLPLPLTGPGHLGITGPGHGPFGITGPGPLPGYGYGKGIGHSGPGPIHGHLLGKAHGIKSLFHGHDGGPTEEHIHHYYVEPLPFAAQPLAPPHVHPAQHAAHSYFSLQAPLLGTKIKYNHYWDLPKSSPHF